MLSTRGAMLGRRDEDGMTDGLELCVLAGMNWLVKAGFARFGVAATWTLGGAGRCDLEEREGLFSVCANFSSARAATSFVAMGRLGFLALLMASWTCASVSFFLRRRSDAAADLAARSTWR